MKESSGFLGFLVVMLLLSALAFFTIVITTGHSINFWDAPTTLATETSAETTDTPTTPTATTAVAKTDTNVELNFVFCAAPKDGVALTSENCSPLGIRRDSSVYVQMANGDPITIDGFEGVNTGFKIKIDSGDTVIAISIENPYFSPIIFGESLLNLKEVSESKTVYLPLST